MMRRSLITLGLLGVISCMAAAPASAQVYFEFGPAYRGYGPGPGYYDDDRPRYRHYRDRRYYGDRGYGDQRYYGGPRYRAEAYPIGPRGQCPRGYTIQHGRCEPYRGY